MKQAYQQFIEEKSKFVDQAGFVVTDDELNKNLKPFQRALTKWALRLGRAALFEGTGLGKTAQQLSWARFITDRTKGNILILTPLAVAQQTIKEAEKFEIDGVAYAGDRGKIKSQIVVTNYERFEKFHIEDFVGVVLDESGIIKSQDGKTRALLTDVCKDIPYRLCCTATPAPNDYAELGQHAEFLGVMTAKEMLSMFFVHDGSIRANDDSAGSDGWRLKRHAVKAFWRWLASWAVVVRHPNDLGFDDPEYDLPPLNLQEKVVTAEHKTTSGSLFPIMASTLRERISARRETATERVAAAAAIVSYKLEVFEECGKKNIMTIEDKNTSLIQKLEKEENSKLDRQKRIESTCVPTIRKTKMGGISLHGKKGTDATRLGVVNMPLTQNSGSDNVLRLAEEIREVNETDDLLRSSELTLSSTTSSLPNKKAAARFVKKNTRISPGSAYSLITATTAEQSEGCFARIATTDLGILKITQSTLQPLLDTSVQNDEPWIIWCNLNTEQDKLERIFGDKCFSVYGSLPTEEKIYRIQGWLAGERPILISKPSICGHGLNMQRCNKMIFVGLTDSFEQVYQAIRRCWRFGQHRSVDCYFVVSELEGNVIANIKRKELAFNSMLDAMAGHMRDLMQEQVLGTPGRSQYHPTKKMETPVWLAS